jgi:hypothetical protein
MWNAWERKEKCTEFFHGKAQRKETIRKTKAAMLELNQKGLREIGWGVERTLGSE